MTKIKNIISNDENITLSFEDGTKLTLQDDGQSCCEHRYMTVDDNLSHYIGATYLGWELADVSNEGEEYYCHDIQFLNIKTSIGDINIANLNVHNGYYGGFLIREYRG